MASLAKVWKEGGYRLQTRGTLSSGNNQRSSGEIASLYTTAVAYGLGSGIALAVVADSSSESGVILPSLVLGGAAAGAVYALDRSVSLKSGVPASISNGLTIGLTHGLAWTLWNQASVDYEDEWSSEAVALVIWGSATVGAVVGGIVGAKRGTSPGRASMLGSTSLWVGATMGMVASALPTDKYKQDDAGMLAAALGLSGGAVLGYVLGEIHTPSVARVRYLDLGGIAGGLIAGGLHLSVVGNQGNESDRQLRFVTAAGMASGLGLAWFATRNMAKEGEEEGASWTTSIAPAAKGSGAVLSAQGLF